MKSAQARAHPRYALEAEIELNAAGRTVRGRTNNVSRGGLCASVTTPIEVGTPVDLSVTLVFDEDTFSEPLTLAARVVWCTALGDATYQIGTAFLPLGPDELEYLQMFLRYLEGGEPKTAGSAGDPGSADPFSG